MSVNVSDAALLAAAGAVTPWPSDTDLKYLRKALEAAATHIITDERRRIKDALKKNTTPVDAWNSEAVPVEVALRIVREGGRRP